MRYEGSGDEPVRIAKAALLSRLADTWPDPRFVCATDLSPPCDDRSFIAAAIALQDAGLIMYDALLVGTGPSNCLDQAMLTHKGLLHVRQRYLAFTL